MCETGAGVKRRAWQQQDTVRRAGSPLCRFGQFRHPALDGMHHPRPVTAERQTHARCGECHDENERLCAAIIRLRVLRLIFIAVH